jgi:hypothetical protein
LKIVNGLTTTDNHSATVNIEYGPDARTSFQDLYQPAAPHCNLGALQSSGGGIFFFGGSWLAGSVPVIASLPKHWLPKAFSSSWRIIGFIPRFAIRILTDRALGVVGAA